MGENSKRRSKSRVFLHLNTRRERNQQEAWKGEREAETKSCAYIRMGDSVLGRRQELSTTGTLEKALSEEG